MADNREEILARMFTILATVTGMTSTFRNRGLIDNDQRPALVLLDGDDSTKTTGSGRGRGRMSPVIISMSPQVFVVLKLAKPQNEHVGTDLNAVRSEIIAKFASDDELLALIGTSGDISYDGCETDLKSGSPMEGQMRLDFTITTVMNPYT